METTEKTSTSLERSALIVATLTSFIAPFMFSSVNVAVPSIQAEFDLNAIELSWIATAYMLAMTIALVPAGKIADIIGRRKVFITGIAVYTIGSGLSCMASSAMLLFISRAVQGIGAAMFVTTGMAILTSIFPPNRRGRVIGIYVAAVYIGLSVGPFVGGWLVQNFGWRSIFLVMVPLGTLAFAATWVFMKGEWVGEEGQRLDIAGCLFYGLSILALVYGATRLPETLGFALLFAGIVLCILFARHQLGARYPIFNMQLLAENKTFTFSSLAALLNYSTTFAITFLLSLYLQYIKGLSPQHAGSILMAQPVMMALLSPIAGRLSDRFEPRLLATAGMVLTVVGVALFATLTPTTPLHLIVANLILLGTGFALFSSPNMSAIMGAVEKRHYGLASGTVATMRLLGQMFSMANATVVLALIIGRKPITIDNYPLFLHSIHTVFLISTVLCIAGVYFSWFRGALHDSEIKAQQ